jgi:hypothetical protein
MPATGRVGRVAVAESSTPRLIGFMVSRGFADSAPATSFHEVISCTILTQQQPACRLLCVVLGHFQQTLADGWLWRSLRRHG